MGRYRSGWEQGKENVCAKLNVHYQVVTQVYLDNEYSTVRTCKA